VSLWSDKCTGQSKSCMVPFVYIFSVSIQIFRAFISKIFWLVLTAIYVAMGFGVVEEHKYVMQSINPTYLEGVILFANKNKSFNVVHIKTSNFLGVQLVANCH